MLRLFGSLIGFIFTYVLAKVNPGVLNIGLTLVFFGLLIMELWRVVRHLGTVLRLHNEVVEILAELSDLPLGVCYTLRCAEGDTILKRVG